MALLGGIIYSVLQWITILVQNSKRVWGLTSKWELAEFGAQTSVLKVSMSYKRGMLSHWAIFWGKKGVGQGVLGSEDPPRIESWCSDQASEGRWASSTRPCLSRATKWVWNKVSTWSTVSEMLPAHICFLLCLFPSLLEPWQGQASSEAFIFPLPHWHGRNSQTQGWYYVTELLSFRGRKAEVQRQLLTKNQTSGVKSYVMWTPRVPGSVLPLLASPQASLGFLRPGSCFCLFPDLLTLPTESLNADSDQISQMWLASLLYYYYYLIRYPDLGASLVAQSIKNLPALQETWVVGQADPLDKERAALSSQHFCLGNPKDRGAWLASVHRVTRVGHDWATKPWARPWPLRLAAHHLPPVLLCGCPSFLSWIWRRWTSDLSPPRLVSWPHLAILHTTHWEPDSGPDITQSTLQNNVLLTLTSSLGSQECVSCLWNSTERVATLMASGAGRAGRSSGHGDPRHNCGVERTPKSLWILSASVFCSFFKKIFFLLHVRW